MQPQSHNRLQEETSVNHRLLLRHGSPPGAFLSQGHYCAHYHQITGCVDPFRKGAMQTFSQLILELILSVADILYIQQGSCCNPMQSTHLWKMMLSSLPCGAVNLKLFLIIIRINIDFNSLQTLCVISLASQHRCKQGWCHTFCLALKPESGARDRNQFYCL